MRVFIAGATGVLGRRVIPRLHARGHTVCALSRSDSNAVALGQMGVEPRRADLFDAQSLEEAARGCDAMLHLATAIPTRTRTRLQEWELNDRIRRDGTSALIAAALANRCALYVQQSVLWVLGDRSGAWVDEATPFADDPGVLLRSAVDMERNVQTARSRGLPGSVLRLGSFVDRDSAHTRALFEMAARGRLAMVGDGATYWNPILVEDAAEAVACTVDKPTTAAGETFHLGAEPPITVREAMETLAQAFGGARITRLPRWLARLVLGGHVLEPMLASVRTRNDKLRDRLGWQAAYPDVRDAIRAEAATWRASRG